jgi:A/G-specific adenine glycosylase
MQGIEEFQEIVWDFFSKHSRELPWRRPEPNGSFDPYKILVSELMLQQTQVLRVVPKYQQFLETFPTVETLAKASLGQVLTAWSGLGYNRRAKFLHQAAQQIAKDGFPQTLNMLTKLPGIGHNTAAAVLTYTYNQPIPFIETNIRTVYIHHFFAGQTDILDKDILLLVEKTFDQENPREFMWALMDYGSYLKQTQGNLGRASKHYTKQSIFHGSKRQIRGQIIKLLITHPYTVSELQDIIQDSRVPEVINDLLRENFIKKQSSMLLLYE